MDNILTESLSIAGRQCLVSRQEAPEALLIEPVSRRDTVPGSLAKAVAGLSHRPFVLGYFPVEDWNSQLSPWDAPPVFGKEGFGHGGSETLTFVQKQLIPAVIARLGLGEQVPAILGGYSLAGLFSLWCAYETDLFAAVAAVSPSVWFPGWMEYTRSRRPGAGSIYLSLGDREEKTRNRVMSAVGDRILDQHALLEASGVRTVLEWNAGGHFADAEGRCARGFAWCLDAVSPAGGSLR